eukprot:GHVS01029006.1.p1 GENE.GHVS01029006.1~~GHVS01029006.1.p1  ORF type:complete len:297 (+),score=62.76 GHVS01029006.1:124-891(+)
MASFAGSPFLQRQVPTGANAPSSFYSDAYIKMEANSMAMAEIARMDEEVLTRMKQTREQYVHTLRDANRFFQEQLQGMSLDDKQFSLSTVSPCLLSGVFFFLRPSCSSAQDLARKETAAELERLSELHKKKEEEHLGEEGEENSNRTGNRHGGTADEHDDIVDLKHQLCEKKMELHKLKSQRTRLESVKAQMQRKAQAANEMLKHQVILLKGIIHKDGSAVCNEQQDLTIDELDQLYEKLLTHHEDMTKARPNAF